MNAADCCENSGSRVILTIDGQKYSIRSKITVKSAGLETKGEANSDGSPYYTTKSKLVEIDVDFSDSCDFDAERIMKCHIDITAECPDIRRTYAGTKFRAVGTPSLNMEDGKIDGLKLMGPRSRLNIIRN